MQLQINTNVLERKAFSLFTKRRYGINSKSCDAKMKIMKSTDESDCNSSWCKPK